MNFTLLTLEWQRKEDFPVERNVEKRPKRIDYHMRDVGKKVTIILLILFQLAYNKADKDLYNLI